MRVPGILARTGIQTYLARELGISDRDPQSHIRLYRPPEEVFNAESMKSFDGLPVTLEHPPGNMVTAGSWRKHAVGSVHDVVGDGTFMRGNLIVNDEKAIKAIESGKKELSNGYVFSLDMTPGNTPDGLAYDGVQRNIRGNHVAIVSAGRCGSACAISDASPDSEKTEAAADSDATNEETKMAGKTVIVDGIPVEATDASAIVIEKLVKERDEARAKVADSITITLGDKSMTFTGTALVEKLKQTDAAIAAKDAEIEALKRDVMTTEARDAAVADWAALIADARSIMPGIQTEKKTCLEIRKAVIAHVHGQGHAKAVVDAALAGRKIETLAADEARSLFNVVKAVHAKPKAGSNIPGALLGDADSAADGKEAKLVGRDAFMAGQQNQFKGQEA